MAAAPLNHQELSLPQCVRGGRVIGADISEAFLTAAADFTYRAIALSNVAAHHALLHVAGFEFIQLAVDGEKEQIPLSDNAVDAVTTTIVLQEIQTERLLYSAIAEMGRVAKAGARLAIAAVSDMITCEDYTAFTYAPFASNATRQDNVRVCQSTVSNIVWNSDRHWSKEILVRGLQEAGWVNVKAEYPIAPAFLRPFPQTPEVSWKDEATTAPLLMITGVKA